MQSSPDGCFFSDATQSFFPTPSRFGVPFRRVSSSSSGSLHHVSVRYLVSLVFALTRELAVSSPPRFSPCLTSPRLALPPSASVCTYLLLACPKGRKFDATQFSLLLLSRFSVPFREVYSSSSGGLHHGSVRYLVLLVFALTREFAMSSPFLDFFRKPPVYTAHRFATA